MRQALIVGGVLGGGSTLVFTVAALVAAMFPTGALVPATPWGSDVRFERAMPAERAPIWIDGTDDGGVLDRPVPIGPGLQVDPGIKVVVPADVANPDEVVH